MQKLEDKKKWKSSDLDHIRSTDFKCLCLQFIKSLLTEHIWLLLYSQDQPTILELIISHLMKWLYQKWQQKYRTF